MSARVFPEAQTKEPQPARGSGRQTGQDLGRPGSYCRDAGAAANSSGHAAIKQAFDNAGGASTVRYAC